MKLNAKDDIEAPIAFVSDLLSDFDLWERAAMRRGAEVERLDSLRHPAPGMLWSVAFPYRSKRRQVEIKLLRLIAGQTTSFQCRSEPANAVVTFDLAEMGPRRTRLVVDLDIKPNTMAARLFIQSLRLAKAKVSKRLGLRLAQLSADIEDRYRSASKP